MRWVNEMVWTVRCGVINVCSLVPPPPPPMGLKFVSKKKPKKSRAERLAEKEEKVNHHTSPSPSTFLPSPPHFYSYFHQRMTMTAILPELEAKNVINELKDVLKIRRPPKQLNSTRIPSLPVFFCFLFFIDL